MSAKRYGILACGSYLPSLRLPKALAADAHAWQQPALNRYRKESRTFCNWDEDALTMAVEAGRDCLAGGHEIDSVEFASTTHPFADRSNAGVLREALGAKDTVAVSDTGGSMRAASTALLKALSQQAETRQLLVGSDCVDSLPASSQEMVLGHGAAAMLIGKGEPLATLRGSASMHQDFVDHYRAAHSRFDYVLEERWTRDAGYRDQVRDTYQKALTDAGLDSVSRLYVAAAEPLAGALAKSLGASQASSDSRQQVGFCGAAESLLMVARGLEQSTAGETFAVVSIGQGIDVMIFECHQPIDGEPLAKAAQSGTAEDNYIRYLSLRGLLDKDNGIRAERDNRTAQSTYWRKHEAINSFIGGKCSACGTLQFPSTKVCVHCGAKDTQEPRRMAEMRGKVRSFTEDWLAYTPLPPLIFGNVGFEDGANVMMEFTDFASGDLEVGMSVHLRFRIKDFDERRGFHRYFWKPAPERDDG